VSCLLRHNEAAFELKYLNHADDWVSSAPGQEDIASTLVRHGCDTTFWSPGPEGCRQTLLHRAINESNETIATFLIKRLVLCPKEINSVSVLLRPGVLC